jgi:hypothetical protein
LRFGISQPRVSQIVYGLNDLLKSGMLVEQADGSTKLLQRVGCESPSIPCFPLAAEDEAAPGELTEEQLVARARSRAIARLEFVFEASLAGWQRSQQVQQIIHEDHDGLDITYEKRTIQRDGTVAFLNQAQKAALALAKVEGVDLGGKQSPEKVKHDGEVASGGRESLAEIDLPKERLAPAKDSRPQVVPDEVVVQAPTSEADLHPQALPQREGEAARVLVTPESRTPRRAYTHANRLYSQVAVEGLEFGESECDGIWRVPQGSVAPANAG